MMTKAEALLALDEGKSVRYRSWWWGRFVFLYEDMLVDECGKRVEESEIFADETGWELYDPSRHESPPALF